MSATIHSADRSEVFALIAAMPGIYSVEQLQFFQLCAQRATHLWVGFIDEEFVGMWGVIPPSFLHNSAYIWLHHTDSVRGKEFLFIRKSRLAMAEVLAVYPEVRGHTVVTDERAVRWLRWLGAEFAEPEGMLMPFVIRRE